MPKASTSANSSSNSTPSSSSKDSQRKAVTKEITELLWDIRRAACLSNSFRKPSLLGSERCKAVAMFTGSSEYVDEHSHPRFADLGRLYHTILVGGTFSRIVYDPVCIPRALLESNEQLANLLLARKMLKPIPRNQSSTKGKSTLSQSSRSSSNRGSTATVSMKLSTGKSFSVASNTPGPSNSTTISGASSSGTAEDDSDIEFGDIHPMLNYQRILQERAQLSSSPAYSAGSKLLRDQMGKGQSTRIVAETMSSPSSPSMDSSDEVERHLARKGESQISVTIYVFTKNIVCIKDVRPIQAQVSLFGNAFFSLDLVETQLVASGLTRSSSIQRFLPHTSVWRDIHWETPFPVKSGAVIALKLSPVLVKDWDIHAPHIFSS